MKYLLICLLALFTISATAQGKGHGKGKGHYKHGWSHTSNLPPGLAKRNGNLPPGLAKKTSLPPGLEKRFATDFPTATKVTWSKRKGNHVARYYTGDYWTTTTYTPQGKIVETRTFIPVAQAPQPVVVYRQANPSVNIADVVRLELPGKEPVYQVRVEKGQYVYLNQSGVRVNF